MYGEVSICGSTGSSLTFSGAPTVMSKENVNALGVLPIKATGFLGEKDVKHVKIYGQLLGCRVVRRMVSRYYSVEYQRSLVDQKSLTQYVITQFDVCIVDESHVDRVFVITGNVPGVVEASPSDTGRRYTVGHVHFVQDWYTQLRVAKGSVGHGQIDPILVGTSQKGLHEALGVFGTVHGRDDCFSHSVEIDRCVLFRVQCRELVVDFNVERIFC